MKRSWLWLVAAVAIGSVACSGSGGGGGNGGSPDGGGSGGGGGGGGGGDQPPTSTGTIAYVHGGELRLVEPDGSGDHLVWSAPQISNSDYRAVAPAWRPNGWEIAFAADHEEAYSIYEWDLYAIRPDGVGLRRLTNAPMRAQLASYPKGTVRATFQNDDVSYSLFIAILQGAEPKTVTLPPGSQATVTFTDVADLGTGLQPIVAANGMYRWLGAFAQVEAGRTVDATGTVRIYANGTIRAHGANEPFWRSDSTKVGYVSDYCQLLQVPSNPPAGASYDPLVASDAFFDPCPVEWGPTAATADQLIAKDGSDYVETSVVHIIAMKEGATTRPAPLISLEPNVQVVDLHWLRDGSGFVFSRQNSLLDHDVNLWQYEFAGETLTQLTDLHLSEGVMRRFSMSPDGTRVAFEMVDRTDPDEFFSSSCDLWVMNRDGSASSLLARDARHPAWNPLK